MAAFTATIARAADPLPSWNDGKAKQSITACVEKVTKPGSPDFVPVAERIATFDNLRHALAASGVEGQRSRSRPCSQAT